MRGANIFARQGAKLKAEREELLDKLRGRCHTMTVVDAMALVGRSERVARKMAQELGEKFKPREQGTASYSRNESDVDGDWLRLTRLYHGKR